MNPISAWRNKEALLRLVGSNCQKCGVRHFPKRDICPDCGTNASGIQVRVKTK